MFTVSRAAVIGVLGLTTAFFAIRWSEVLLPGRLEMKRGGPFYSFKVLDSARNTVDLGAIARGKVALVVNVASE